MKIVQNKITDYLSINVSENETAWSVSELYDYGDEVRDGHYIYKYAGENETNTDDSPSVVFKNAGDSFSVWVRTRATNYWSALDEKTLTQTIAPNQLILEIANNDYDTISLLNLSATDVIIEVIDLTTGLPIQDGVFNYDLKNTVDIIDEQSYWYAPFDFRTSVYEPNIYLVPNTKIKITINNTGSNAGLGRIIGGSAFFIGDTLYPATLDIITFSSFRTDIFGNTDLKQGQSIKNQTWNILIPTERIPALERKRSQLVAIPILFIMDESQSTKIDNALVYGYFQNAPFQVANATISNIPIQIKGLV